MFSRGRAPGRYVFTSTGSTGGFSLAVLFLPMAAIAVPLYFASEGERGSWSIVALMLAFAAILVWDLGAVTVDMEGITWRWWFRRRSLRWTEIHSVRYEPRPEVPRWRRGLTAALLIFEGEARPLRIQLTPALLAALADVCPLSLPEIARPTQEARRRLRRAKVLGAAAGLVLLLVAAVVGTLLPLFPKLVLGALACVASLLVARPRPARWAQQLAGVDVVDRWDPWSKTRAWPVERPGPSALRHYPALNLAVLLLFAGGLLSMAISVVLAGRALLDEGAPSSPAAIRELEPLDPGPLVVLDLPQLMPVMVPATLASSCHADRGTAACRDGKVRIRPGRLFGTERTVRELRSFDPDGPGLLAWPLTVIRWAQQVTVLAHPPVLRVRSPGAELALWTDGEWRRAVVAQGDCAVWVRLHGDAAEESAAVRLVSGIRPVVDASGRCGGAAAPAR